MNIFLIVAKYHTTFEAYYGALFKLVRKNGSSYWEWETMWVCNDENYDYTSVIKDSHFKTKELLIQKIKERLFIPFIFIDNRNVIPNSCKYEILNYSKAIENLHGKTIEELCESST